MGSFGSSFKIASLLLDWARSATVLPLMSTLSHVKPWLSKKLTIMGWLPLTAQNNTYNSTLHDLTSFRLILTSQRWLSSASLSTSGSNNSTVRAWPLFAAIMIAVLLFLSNALTFTPCFIRSWAQLAMRVSMFFELLQASINGV
jgi:hypothetical protein